MKYRHCFGYNFRMYMYMLQAEGIRQAEWIKIAILISLNTVKKIYNVRIHNPTILALRILDLKFCFHP